MERFPGTRSLRRLRAIAAKKSAAASARRSAGRRPTFELLEDRRVFALQVVVVLPSLTDSGGASTAWVQRTGSLAQPLSVTLVSSHPAAATVPSTVIIPANATAAPFDVTAVDDDSLNASVTVTITASAIGHANASDAIAIVNDEFLALPTGTATDVVNVSPGQQPGQHRVTMGPQPAPSLGTPVYASFAGESPYQTSGANVAVQASEFIPVDATKTYALAGWAKSGDEFGQRYNPANRQSFGFAAYDANYNLLPAQPGESYSFTALDSQAVPGDWSWKQYAAVFTGASLPSGTAYIKPVIIANEHGADDNFISWRDVSITQVPAGTTAAALAAPPVDLSVNPAGDQRYALPMGGTHADRLVKVDVNARYTLSAWGENSQAPNERVFGFDSYDVDKKLIHPLHVARHGHAVDARLAAALTPGDTALYINDASGWSYEPWESAETRSLAWYGYADSTGHVYADYTYTRNVAFDFDDGLWAPGAIHFDLETGAYRIQLNKPWSGPVIPGGAAIRNATGGESLNLPGEPQPIDTSTGFVTHAATIGGGVWQQGRRDEAAFRPGTAYIQPAFARPLSAREVVMGHESDAVYGGPLDPTQRTLEVNATQQASIDLDVLAKGVFGGAATVVIDSVTPPAYGTAAIVPGVGPGGRAVINYLSPPSFLGTVVVQYTLRNTANNQTVALSATINVLGGELQALGTLSANVFDSRYAIAAGQTLNGDGVDAPKLALNTAGVVANTTVRLVGGPKHGTLSFNPNGTFVYTPAAGFSGNDSFRYEALRTSGPTTLTAVITVHRSVDDLVLARLTEIGRGMQNYESSRNRFPLTSSTASHFDATGKPFLSWRVHILPFIGYQSLYAQFRLNEAWNSAHNAPLQAQMPDIFRSAGDASNSTTTRYQIISGEGAPYYWRRSGTLLVGPTHAQFTDGTANSLLVVERGANKAITWTRPEAQDFSTINPLASLGAIASDRIHAVMADGRTLSLPASIDATTFKNLVTISGGELLDADTLRRQFAETHGGDPAAYSYGAVQNDAYFRNIALAMLNYSDAKGQLPVDAGDFFDVDGNPYLSWRVHLLPFLGHQALYSQFNLQEPWNSATNLPLLSKMPDVFRSAGDASNSTTTRVMTFTGPDAPFGRRAPGTAQSGPSIQQFTDGTSNTILFLEAGPNRAVPWTKPDDVPLDVNNPLVALGDLSGGEIRAALADGSVLKLPSDIAPATLAALATLRGEELLDAAAITRRELARMGQLPQSRSPLNNFKRIAVAMHDYESVQARFPASSFTTAGQPLLSWRVLILPYLGYGELYSQFNRNEPWDSPHNLALLEHMPDVFRSLGDSWDSTTTRAMTFTGPGAPFTGTTGEGPRFTQLIDGSSNTFAVVEAGPDTAVPWTKPVDLPFDRNNPFSALGELGPHLLAAFFDGSVRTMLSSMSIDQLSAYITHNGNDFSTPPPVIPNVPAFTIRQTAGDTATHEFGVDVFYVVLDKAPLTNVVLSLDTSLAESFVGTLDKNLLTFTPDNWNVPQRVAFRAADFFNVNVDRMGEVIVSVLDHQSDDAYDPLPDQTFSALVRNVAAPQPPDADFNGDAIIDGTDFLAWQRGIGATGGDLKSQGDANGDGVVGSQDLAAWRTQFGAGAAASPADFNGDTHVNAADLGAWRTNFGTPAGATAGQGDADLDGDVDGADFLTWQRSVTGSVTPAAPAAAAAYSAAMLAPTTDLLLGLSAPFTRTTTADDVVLETLALQSESSVEPIQQRARALAFASLPARHTAEEHFVDLTSAEQSHHDADAAKRLDSEFGSLLED
jgi:hypothetical protein